MSDMMGDSAFDAARYLEWIAPGHFYSPIPDHREIVRQAERIFAVPEQLPGIDLRGEAQLQRFAELAPLARELGLPLEPDGSFRYHADNWNYGIGDALMLGSFLRALRPKRYLEVGSGFTTAVALDVNERYLDNSMSLTAIEPFPELVRGLMRDGDAVEIIDTPVQDVPPERFMALEANDLLFIDDSHVVKTGSDAHFLITRVLPSLAPGVVVHVHDIFWPFEYSRTWIDEGRAWSEAYLLHAFLAFNSSFRIEFFNNWFLQRHRERIEAELPMMLENAGGALWMRRIA